LPAKQKDEPPQVEQHSSALRRGKGKREGGRGNLARRYTGTDERGMCGALWYRNDLPANCYSPIANRYLSVSKGKKRGKKKGGCAHLSAWQDERKKERTTLADSKRAWKIRLVDYQEDKGDKEGVTIWIVQCAGKEKKRVSAGDQSIHRAPSLLVTQGKKGRGKKKKNANWLLVTQREKVGKRGRKLPGVRFGKRVKGKSFSERTEKTRGLKVNDSG